MVTRRKVVKLHQVVSRRRPRSVTQQKVMNFHSEYRCEPHHANPLRQNTLALRTWLSGLRWLCLLTFASCTPAADRDRVASNGDSASPLTTVALGAPPIAPPPDAFVGAATCASCHADQFTAWQTSTHGTAGGVTDSRGDGNQARVIAPFDGTLIRFRDATIVPRQRDGTFSFVVQRPGERDTTLMVDAVIGGGHMAGGGTQGFATMWSDGTLRFLPFDWSRQNRTWFCNTGTRSDKGWQPITTSMRLADCGDWPPSRVLGDAPEFSNCQSCHGSQIDLAFDTSAKRWQTRVNSFAVNCESCHGPAARHVRLMKSGEPPTADIGLPALAALSKTQSVTTCNACHALKTRLVSAWRPGADLSQFYSVLLSQLGETPLTADGRTRTFAYQEGHLSSDCYRNGGMTCTSCHDPHSQRYRTVDELPLPGRIDDRQCTSCHASKVATISTHTKHAAASVGSRCVSCHMPYQQQHALGNAIQYKRSDHTISIPRPAVDSALGIVSACRSCHATETESRHRAQIADWWGASKPHEIAVTGLLASPTVNDIGQAARLLLEPFSQNATAQVAGLSQWLERFGAPDMNALPPVVEERLRSLSQSSDPDVRALALATLHYVLGSNARTRQFLQLQLRNGAPSVLRRNANDQNAALDALRRRWAIVLGGIGDAARSVNDPVRAITAYGKALEVTPDEPALLVNMGLAYAERGDLTLAVSAYQRALSVKAGQPVALVNLGTALERRGDVAGGADAFRRAIALDPTAPTGHLNLGTNLLREGRSAEAIPHFERAVARAPGLAIGHFQLALAWLKEAQLVKAAAAVRRSLAFDTTNAEALKLDAALRQELTGRPQDARN